MDGGPKYHFEPEMRLTLRRISGPYKEANIIDEHRQVKGSRQISIQAADLLEDMRPQHYNGANRVETVRTINDILQGRTERTVDAFLTGLRNTGGEDCAQRVEEISREIQAFLTQKALLSRPYTKSSDKQYKYRSFDLDPERPLKIVNQRLYDQAAKAGFPPNFFRETFFDNVTFYCIPDHTDFNFSYFSNCAFVVCRIREATFDGTRIYSTEFHSCAMQYVTFHNAAIAHTHFHDSTLKSVSFQGARLKSCNTVDCELDGVGFLKATLDGCFFGRVAARGIRNLHTATITQGGATDEEVKRNREAIFAALRPEQGERWELPTKKRGGR